MATIELQQTFTHVPTVRQVVGRNKIGMKTVDVKADESDLNNKFKIGTKKYDLEDGLYAVEGLLLGNRYVIVINGKSSVMRSKIRAGGISYLLHQGKTFKEAVTLSAGL